MTCKESSRLTCVRKEFLTRASTTGHTAQEVAATEHVPGRMFAKTVMVLPDDEHEQCWCCQRLTTSTH